MEEIQFYYAKLILLMIHVPFNQFYLKIYESHVKCHYGAYQNWIITMLATKS